MTILYKYNLSNFFTSQIHKDEFSLIARVISVNKLSYKVISYNGEVKNALIKKSNLYYNKLSESLLPKVGDFILLEQQEKFDKNNYIKQILTRKNSLKRKLIGKSSEEQIIATNIDIVFVVISATEYPNLNKIDRMILTCKSEPDILPIIVINKIDLFNDYHIYIDILKKRFSNIDIIIATKTNQSLINEFYKFITSSTTAVLIGSSGVGKSTLINMLFNKNIQKVSSVSLEKFKGTHTTTHRELFVLPNGGCIIDNPGIKEFGIYLDNEKYLYNLFADIIDLSAQCKFSNCNHTTDLGCKILPAIESDINLKTKFENYLKLKNEVDYIKNNTKHKNNFKKKKIISKTKIKFRKKVDTRNYED